MPVSPPNVSPLNLTDAAYFARLAVKYGAILLVLFMVGRVTLNTAVSLYKRLNPPKPPGPTYGFGTLPTVQFPRSQYAVSSYTLQTKDGSLPILADQMRVYFMPTNKVTLFSVDRAKQMAATLNYLFTPEQTSTTMYRWKRTTPLLSSLDIDIVSQNFSSRTDWASDPNFLSKNQTIPQQNNAISESRNIIRSLNLAAPDIATGEARVTFLKALGDSYGTAMSYSEADFVQVDIFRVPAQGLFPILRPDPSQGSARFIFSGSQQKESHIVFMDFVHFPIEYDRYETYGLISTAEAWKQLQDGKGYVAFLDNGISNVIVRNVYLAYYDADTPQNYLQPIYVFTGDNNFFGYVPAVAATPKTKK